jgi:serine/threonine-protein kinase RsbW
MKRGIKLSLPGALEFRDVAVRVVGGSCKFLGAVSTPESLTAGELNAMGPGGSELSDQFVTEVVSAFSEAFNNLALHGYRDMPPGRIDIEIIAVADAQEEADGTGRLILRITDTGRVFDPSDHMDLPDELPERGMGLFIMRSFMDEVTYAPGPPNVLTLVKRYRSK